MELVDAVATLTVAVLAPAVPHIAVNDPAPEHNIQLRLTCETSPHTAFATPGPPHGLLAEAAMTGTSPAAPGAAHAADTLAPDAADAQQIQFVGSVTVFELHEVSLAT